MLFVESGVEVVGNIEYLKSLRSIVEGLDVDWEAILANFSGDVVAHEVGKTVRAAKHWMRDTNQEMSRLVSEYLGEELSVVATSDEVDEFCDAVDELRLSVDRLEAKIRNRATACRAVAG